MAARALALAGAGGAVGGCSWQDLAACFMTRRADLHCFVDQPGPRGRATKHGAGVPVQGAAAYLNAAKWLARTRAKSPWKGRAARRFSEAPRGGACRHPAAGQRTLVARHQTPSRYTRMQRKAAAFVTSAIKWAKSGWNPAEAVSALRKFLVEDVRWPGWRDVAQLLLAAGGDEHQRVSRRAVEAHRRGGNGIITCSLGKFESFESLYSHTARAVLRITAVILLRNYNGI